MKNWWPSVFWNFQFHWTIHRYSQIFNIDTDFIIPSLWIRNKNKKNVLRRFEFRWKNFEFSLFLSIQEFVIKYRTRDSISTKVPWTMFMFNNSETTFFLYARVLWMCPLCTHFVWYNFYDSHILFQYPWSNISDRVIEFCIVSLTIHDKHYRILVTIDKHVPNVQYYSLLI